MKDLPLWTYDYFYCFWSGKKKKNAQEVKQLKRGGIDKQQALKQISG